MTSLPVRTHVGKVRLAVSDLERSVRFYSDVIGLRVLNRQASFAQLSAQDSDTPLVELQQLPGLQPLERQRRLGMYHFAVLLPGRSDLANFVRHLTEIGVEFGSADHLFSEATYLVDPDGLTVEVYSDRPREVWTRDSSGLKTAVDPLDFQNLLSVGDGHWAGAPTGTTVGHIHLYVGDLDRARAFYVDGLGFDLMTALPGAIFVAADGYHHHVGLNTWAARSPIAGETDPRLLFWELVLPSDQDVAKVAERLVALGYPSAGEAAFSDPWQIVVQLVFAQT